MSGEIEGKGDRLSNLAAQGVLQEQLQFRGVGGDQAEPPPARCRQMLFDQGQQAFIQKGKDPVGEFLPGFRKGLSRHFAPEIGSIIEVGGEDIEFRLKAGGEAGQEHRQQAGER